MRAFACSVALLWASSPAAADVKANGYLDSRSAFTDARVDRVLPARDVPELQELLEGNVQIKAPYAEAGYVYGDLSLFFQLAGLFYDRAPDGSAVRVPDHDLPAYRNLVSLNELYVDHDAGPHLTLLGGRKRTTWGAGLAVNPTDLVNPPKDPTDPSAQRAGAWLLEAQAPFEKFTFTALWSPQVLYSYDGLPARWLDYPAYPPFETQAERTVYGTNRLYPDPRASGERQLVALRAYTLFKESDINLMYFWSNLYGDLFSSKSRVGFSFSRYFFTDYELHIEGLIQRGSARMYACGPAGVRGPSASGLALCSPLGPVSFRELDSGRITPRILAGTRYMFSDESTISVEYLYQGDGYGRTDFANYVLLLQRAQPLLDARALVLSQGVGQGGLPQRFAFDPLRRHYTFVSYSKPKIRDDWTAGVVLIANLEDTSALLSPSLAWSATEWLTLTAYGFVPLPGIARLGVDVGGTRYAEFALAPLRYRALLEARLFY